MKGCKRLIVIASPEEISLVKSDDKTPILITGIGALNVMNALADVPRDTTIVNFGYCGSGTIPVGTTVRIHACDLYHPGVSFPDRWFHLRATNSEVKPVVCHTISDFGGDPSQDNCVYDMELAFICGMGFHEVESFKTVSDCCSLEEYHKTIAKK